MCQICKWYVLKSPLEPKVFDDLGMHWMENERCNEKRPLVENMWKEE